MQIANAVTAPKYYELAGNLRAGNRDARVLLTGKEDAPNNYRFGYGTGEAGGNWTTPRHHHNFEQIRHPVAGDYVIAKDEVLPAGWVGYFPESAYYGPQTLKDNLDMYVMQFGGPSGNGFASVRQRRKGYDDLLAKGGKFEGGVYTWTDEKGVKHNQDAFEATWEQMYGRKVEYPVGRYRDLVIMNPAAFSWVKDDDAPGVTRKILGTFTERQIRIGFMRLDKGATLTFGTEKSPEALAVKEGAMTYQGETYPRLSAFGTEADDQPIKLTAKEETELFYIKLPTF